MNRLHWASAPLLLSCLAFACGDDASPGGADGGGDAGVTTEPICSAEELSAALAAASPGDTVVIGDCEIRGSFSVGTGVSLQGQGTSSSKLIAESSAILLTLLPGTDTTTIGNLSLDCGGWIGISASQASDGTLVLEDLALTITQGAGITISGPALAQLRRISLQGPFDAQNAPAVAAGDLSFANSAYVGVLASGGRVELEDVDAAGFAMAGAAFIDAELTWDGGGASESYQHGVYLKGGTAELSKLQIENNLALSSYNYGLVSFDGAEVQATALTVSGNDKFGIVQLAGTTATYTDLTAADNGSAALWVQQATGLNIVGMNGFMSSNTMAGVVVKDTASVSISQLLIEDTQVVPHIVGMDVHDVGDGVQLFDSFANLSIQDSRVSLNGRAGIVLESSTGVIPDGIFSGVTANSADGALGVVAQSLDAAIAAGDTWDQGVTREGDAVTTDIAHSARLVTSAEIVGMNGVVAPPSLAIEAAP